MIPYRKSIRIIVVHPLRPLLDTFMELERRMINGAKFPIEYVNVSDRIRALSQIVEGTKCF